MLECSMDAWMLEGLESLRDRRRMAKVLQHSETSEACLECLAVEAVPRLLRSNWSADISAALTPDALLHETARTDLWDVLQCDHRFFVDAYPRHERPGRTFNDFATSHSSRPGDSSGGETVTK